MKKVVTFGEILLRLSPPGHLRFSQTHTFEAMFGGAESNVAVSLANYGIPVEFVTRLPENDIGKCAEMDLCKRNVGTSHISFGGKRIGIYYLEQGAVNRGSKVIYDRAHSAMATISEGSVDWKAAFKDAQWFHWSGITPALSQNAANICLEAIEAANDLGLVVSTDLNYRSKLWNYGKEPKEVMPQLVKKCDVIVGGRYAAERYFDISFDIEENSSPAKEELIVCEQLMNHFPNAKKIVATLRDTVNASHNNLSGVLFNGEDALKAPTYSITHIVDRVGGGDSFMGGLIYGLLTFEKDQEALDFAVAASTLKHTIPGDVNLSTVAEVENLMKGNASGRVSR